MKTNTPFKLPVKKAFMIVRSNGTLSSHGGFEESPAFLVFSRKSDAESWISENLCFSKHAPFSISSVIIQEASE
jgi:hypothetical protein